MALIRTATAADLVAIVGLLAEDSPDREEPGPPLPNSYREALGGILADPRSTVLVAEDEGLVIGMLQLDFLRRLSFGGRWVAEIESVHVRADRRSRGIGEQLLSAALEQARAQGCQRVQLTSQLWRTDAHRFYLRLGFAQSHAGFKLVL